MLAVEKLFLTNIGIWFNVTPSNIMDIDDNNDIEW